MNKTLAKIFCVTRDEYDIIEDFLIYYGYLFGYKNIIIIDNNSVNEHVLDIYEKYKLKGVNIFKESNYTGNGQGEMFTKYMNIYKDQCEFLIGLDTDEFLTSFPFMEGKNDLPIIKDRIYNFLNNLDKSYTIIFMNMYPYITYTSDQIINYKFDRPIYQMNKFLNNSIGALAKKIYRSESFIYTTSGNHNGYVKYGNKYYCNDFCYIHYNDVGTKRSVERAKMIIDGYKYFDTNMSNIEQLTFMVKNRHIFDNGIHRVNEYNKFLLKQYILQLFVKYIKRLPSIDELNNHVYKNINTLPYIIEKEFINCEEKIKSENIFFDANISDMLYLREVEPQNYMESSVMKNSLDYIASNTF